MNVYIDLTEFMKIEVITGIQRVVREIVLRFIKSMEFDTVLLSYSERDDRFRIIDNAKFQLLFEKGQGARVQVYSNASIAVDELEAGAVFFEIDVAWTATLKRSYLLPILKRNGVRIVSQIYDIMAITHWQYFTEHFTYTFMEFIGAHIQYADLIIVSTKASLDILQDFAERVGVGRINGRVANLGADFQKNEADAGSVSKAAAAAADGRKYILMVGTIEPRKNHQLVLNAFDRGLDKLGYSIIFAGRIGWKNKAFLSGLHSHPAYDKRIFHLDHASNADIDYLYRHARLVAFPTHMEGFGLPLVEALERGVPVVATDIGVLREIGGEYCYYFGDNDVDAFVRCAAQAEKDPDGYNAKRAALAYYRPVTWDETARIMMDAILQR